ncbi:MAG TPA: enoyl-CoA-hydratase DpgB [Actinoplanes sp.]|nr:enoyl-CoA-hydratase DpgB [Actinoplanes sp.]
MHDELVISIDGNRPISAETVAEVAAACDTAEDLARTAAPGARLVVSATGAAATASAADLTIGLVSKWERVLHRLERLPLPTVATATGDCGGPALDALLATDYRIAAASARLVLPVEDGATWPGMAVYRLARQAWNAAVIRRAVLFGTPIDVADALTLQLVHEVTEDMPGALARSGRVTGAVAGAELAIRRQLLLDAPTVSFDDALGVHLAACDRAIRQAGAWSAA